MAVRNKGSPARPLPAETISWCVSAPLGATHSSGRENEPCVTDGHAQSRLANAENKKEVKAACSFKVSRSQIFPTIGRAIAGTGRASTIPEEIACPTF